MPRRPKPSKFKKKRFLLVAAAVVVIVAGLVYWKVHRDNERRIVGVGIATHSSPADNDLNNQRKASSAPATTLDNGPTTSTSSGASSSNSVGTLTVTRAGVVNSNLQVGTLVSNGTTGTCELSVSQAGQQTVTASSQVTLQNNSYSCPVFNIPLSSFPNLGEWNVSVSLTNGTASTTSTWADNPVNLSGTP